MSEIRVDAPGAGEWIMARVGGVWLPTKSHTLSTHRGERMLGGFVLSDYISEASAMLHMAGDKPGWCNRELLRVLFEYAFNQLQIRKAFALVRSDNHRAIQMELRAGWRIETMIRELYGEGVHAFVLYMTPAICPWLSCRQSRVVVLPFGADPRVDAA